MHNEVNCTCSAFERELHAAVASVRHFSAYLYGHNFTLYSDNRALVQACLNDSQNPIYSMTAQSQLRYLKEKIGTVKHVQGVANEVADMLSQVNPDITVQDVKLKGNDGKIDPTFVGDLRPTLLRESCASSEPPSINLCMELPSEGTSSRIDGILAGSPTEASFI